METETAAYVADLPVTCMACRVRLIGADERREHYRTDMHRVNLQRKVAGMPPLTAGSLATRRQPRFCDVCSKKFSSASALANHNASRRHRDAARVRGFARGELEGEVSGGVSETAPLFASDAGVSARAGIDISPVESDDGDMDIGEVGSDGLTAEQEAAIERRIAEAEPLAANECVFDLHVSDTPEDNLTYMAKKFGFFVPYVESLIDVNGLLEYLGQKVGIGYACVECDKTFTSVAGVQRHMVDKQHCRMTSDDDVWAEEYIEFYDFGVDETYDTATDGGDGWEEVEGDEARQADEELTVAATGRSAGASSSTQVAFVSEERKEREMSEYEATQEEEVAMVVRDGTRVIGHRSLQRYYKQSGRAQTDSRDAVVINKVVSEYRMLGWKGHTMPAGELKHKRQAAFRHAKCQMEVGMKNYYTRKASIRVSFAALNSGYRP
jgi:pre-60S factor REI1